MSLLSLVSDAMILCGFSAPSTVYGNTDANVTLFRLLSQVEGDALSRRYDWRGLKVLGTMTGDGSSTEYTLPTDFDRFVTGYPLYMDGTPQLPLHKVSDDDMLAMKVAETQPTNPVWRLFGDTIEYYPAPESGDIIKIEYRSKYWIVDEDLATRKATWAEDTDLALMPERLITLGLIWRYKHAKGLDYAEDFRTYQIESHKAGTVNNGRQTIVMRSNFLPDYADAPLTDPRVTP
jgi:hypothetical protein